MIRAVCPFCFSTIHTNVRKIARSISKFGCDTCKGVEIPRHEVVIHGNRFSSR